MSKEIPKYERMLESELERNLVRLKAEEVNTEDYKKALTTVERLHGLMDKRRPSPVSKDTLVMAGTNLVGILLILRHENVNVITSKALSFVFRAR